jgi:hypothetical protein
MSDSELDNQGVHLVSLVEIGDITSRIPHCDGDDGADTLIMRKPRERRLNVGPIELCL